MSLLWLRLVGVVAGWRATAAVICQLAFHLIGARVDRQGVLHEPFALQPISVLLLVSSGLALIGARGRPKPLP